jgi:flagellar biosynthesis protein FlhF
MKTKKIVADSMPLALKMVRQQLGDNAIIVNTKAIKTGGVFGFFAKQKFEVTAYSIDKEGVSGEPKFSVELKAKSEINNRMSGEISNSVFHKKPQELYHYYSQPAVGTEKQASPPPQPLEKENPFLDELTSMRKMMMAFMMNEQQGNTLPPGLAKCVNSLKKQGVDEEIIEYIVSCMLKRHESMVDMAEDVIEIEVITIVKEIIEKRVPATNQVNDTTRMINVIGPTGVGKTTTIAKLATEQVLKQRRRVAMITTDVYRIAAVEQLKTYAGILNVPLEVVRTKDELEKALSKLAHYDLIYMDTTGRNYKEVKYRESINEFLNHPLESDNYLVLSLTTKFEDMQILLNEFRESPIQKLILTKFDETTSYGSILNVAYKYPFQLAYITNGQSVPEDITAIDATLLARYLLGKEN